MPVKSMFTEEGPPQQIPTVSGMNLLATEQRGIIGTYSLSAAGSGELTQMTPPLPLPLKGRDREGLLNIPVVKEEDKFDLVPTFPPIIPKPIPQSSYPNSQYGKKKKIRPKRPRIALKNLSKPISMKEDTGTKQSEESQETPV